MGRGRAFWPLRCAQEPDVEKVGDVNWRGRCWALHPRGSYLGEGGIVCLHRKLQADDTAPVFTARSNSQSAELNGAACYSRVETDWPSYC